MSDFALSAPAVSTMKPAGIGLPDPPGGESGDSGAFAAIAASIGFETLQTSARQHAQPAAIIGRPGGAPGNVLPLRSLNQVPGQHPQPGLGTLADALPVPTLHDTRPGPAKPEAFFAGPHPGDAGRFDARFGWQPASLPSRGLFPVASGVPIPANASVQEPLEALLPTALARPPVVAPDPVPGLGVTAATGSVTGAGIVTAEAPVPLHHARFGETFAQQVSVMARDGVQHARITVNPAELGPVELRIVVRNDEATVQFAASHVAVREALEEALPRLREQFEQSGMRLHDGTVSEHLPQQHGEHGRGLAYATDDSAHDVSVDTAAAGDERGVVRRGLIDAYA